ncbi:MAG: UDP-N-acetylmuramate--alanine ligase [Bacteroidota bacterium]|jgi:UDP-N-acetylmuramate--alanine ligase|nr:UDP-N-acetylmuramate--alanine ligase [Bacteroidota bacterium]
MKDITHIYFLGIGGIGMSALARYFNAMGKNVSGYDKTSTKLTGELIAEGISIHFEDNLELVQPEFRSLNSPDKSKILVVYTPAVPKSHSEYVFFNSNGFNIKKRAEVLGLITESARTIAVAGTHGKTTTSSLVAHILKTAGLDPSAFLGGITQNYKTNLLLSSKLKEAHADAGYVVVEADEYDRSFLTLHPEIAVITSVDADHLDIYGDKTHVEESFSMFADLVRKKLIVKKNIAGKVRSALPAITYSVDDVYADYHAMDIRIENGFYHYSIKTPKGILKNVTLGLPGKHNVENSVAAAAIACELHIADVFIKDAMRTFGGVKRRFDYQIKTESLVYIDDYAHHPEELKATINSAREMYPGKKITGIFQPHLFSRTRDFADEFAQSLDLLDECILMEIYPARELPIDGVDSQMLLDKMKSSSKMICDKNELLNTLAKKKVDVLLTMGAGDIDTFVEKIKNQLSK